MYIYMYVLIPVAREDRASALIRPGVHFLLRITVGKKKEKQKQKNEKNNKKRNIVNKVK